MAGKIDKQSLALRAKDKEIGHSEQLARALADYDNLVKRIGREKEEIVARATKNLVEDLLPVLDNFERANSHLKDSGLEVAIGQFKQILAGYGVEEIKVKAGDTFDSKLHEVIETLEGGKQGTIAQVLVHGYNWRDGMVIRPAKVRVFGDKQENGEK